MSSIGTACALPASSKILNNRSAYFFFIVWLKAVAFLGTNSGSHMPLSVVFDSWRNTFLLKLMRKPSSCLACGSIFEDFMLRWALISAVVAPCCLLFATNSKMRLANGERTCSHDLASVKLNTASRACKEATSVIGLAISASMHSSKVMRHPSTLSPSRPCSWFLDFFLLLLLLALFSLFLMLLFAPSPPPRLDFRKSKLSRTMNFSAASISTSASCSVVFTLHFSGSFTMKYTSGGLISIDSNVSKSLVFASELRETSRWNTNRFSFSTFLFFFFSSSSISSSFSSSPVSSSKSSNTSTSSSSSSSVSSSSRSFDSPSSRNFLLLSKEVSKSSNAFGNVHPSLPSNAISRSKKVSRFFSILCNARENFREGISRFDIKTTPVLLFSSLLFSCSRQFRIKRGVQFLV